MKEIFRQYVQIIGYSLIGIAFGFSFFYLFLNLYHYQEIRREVGFDFQNDASVIELKQTIDHVKENLQAYQNINYQGTLDYAEAGLWQTKLNVCVQSFENETLQKILLKNKINIQDVYEFRDSFDKSILNSCVVKQLYSLVGENPVNSEFIRNNKLLFKNYMDDLLQDTSYLKKDLNANSNYYFVTDMTALSVKNDVQDGFYEVMSAYNKSAKFLEAVSEWYKREAGGVQ